MAWISGLNTSFPDGSDGKEPACSAEDPASMPGLGTLSLAFARQLPLGGSLAMYVLLPIKNLVLCFREDQGPPLPVCAWILSSTSFQSHRQIPIYRTLLKKVSP